MAHDPVLKSQGRVSEQRYVDLPDGHRTTLVVGMADMLSRMTDYLPPDRQDAFLPLLEYAATFESGALREEFDRYIAEDPATPTTAIASSFIGMLVTRTGALRSP
jgi:hypothetical protein